MNLCKWDQITTGADALVKMSHYVDIGAMFGNKDLKNSEDDHLSVRYNSGAPTYTVYWMYGINSSNSNIAANARGSIEMTYYVKFYERKNTFLYAVPV